MGIPHIKADAIVANRINRIFRFAQSARFASNRQRLPAGRSRLGHLRLPAGRTARLNDLVSHVPHQAWERYIIKEGSQGPIVCDFAFLRITEARQGQPGRQVWLVLRRNVADPTEIKFYLSNASARLPRTELVRLSSLGALVAMLGLHAA